MFLDIRNNMIDNVTIDNIKNLPKKIEILHINNNICDNDMLTINILK